MIRHGVKSDMKCVLFQYPTPQYRFLVRLHGECNILV